MNYKNIFCLLFGGQSYENIHSESMYFGYWTLFNNYVIRKEK
jgi:hypothetical protein